MPLILVLDDRVTNRALLARLAANLAPDAVVRDFADPCAALDWTASTTPDLVVTDFKMPGLNGAEFIRRFRQQPDHADVPLIVVTAYEDREYRYEALAAGATDYLLSPVDRQEFQARCQNLLTIRKQQLIIMDRARMLEAELAHSDRLRHEALKQSEATLRGVIDTVPAMISATDAAGRYGFLNRFQADTFGVSQEKAAGKTASEIVDSDFGRRSRELDAKVFALGRTLAGFEEELLTPAGEKRILLTTKSPLCDGEGRVLNVVTVSLDITERKRAEEQLRVAKESAELANRTKTEFMANMSHELRTPLNAIIGFADIIRAELLGSIGSPRYREYARDIGDSARHLLSIINDILDVSKIEAGKLELHEEAIDLDNLIDDVFRLVHERADGADITLRRDADHPVPGLFADSRKIKQILLNLLSNAIKFTFPGGTVSIGRRVGADGGLQITVRDTGIGIAPEHIPIATARFGQVDSSMTRRYSGTGLGLPLTIGLIELHQGTLDIQSEVGRGTIVTVSMPPHRTVPQERATRARTG
ncbi:MAG: ATP-binding protein [Rhodospirillales bacterium]|nr:ATP-binding protein [Rhodospirillales bacterium]